MAKVRDLSDTQQQMVLLFHTTKQNVSLHINNIFKEGELQREVAVKESLTTTIHGAIDGKTQLKRVFLYNLDVIISVGYRVKSQAGTRFRQWATSVLKQYMLKGYAVHPSLQQVEYHLTRQIEGQREELYHLKHNQQCAPIQKIQLPQAVHDRYLIIDEQVWLLGASVKDMGRGLCTIIRLGFTPDEILKRL